MAKKTKKQRKERRPREERLANNLQRGSEKQKAHRVFLGKGAIMLAAALGVINPPRVFRDIEVQW